MSVNVRGVMLCFKHAAQQMIKQGGGGKIIGSLWHFHQKPGKIADEGGVLHVHLGACSIAGKRGGFHFEVRVTRCLLTLVSKGLPNICAYSMSKFAVRGLVQSLGKLFFFSITETRKLTFGSMS